MNKINKHIGNAMKHFKKEDLVAAQEQVDEARALLQSMTAEREQEQE